MRVFGHKNLHFGLISDYFSMCFISLKLASHGHESSSFSTFLLVITTVELMFVTLMIINGVWLWFKFVFFYCCKTSIFSYIYWPFMFYLVWITYLFLSKNYVNQNSWGSRIFEIPGYIDCRQIRKSPGSGTSILLDQS